MQCGMQSSITLRIKLEQCGLGMRLSPNLQVIAEKVSSNRGEGKGENEGGGIQWEENEA